MFTLEYQIRILHEDGTIDPRDFKTIKRTIPSLPDALVEIDMIKSIFTHRDPWDFKVFELVHEDRNI